jgi:FlaA1/EpsC-like NDP-sugar epimerase
MNQSLKEKISLSRTSNLYHRIISSGYLPRWVVLFGDIVLSTTICILSFYLAPKIINISTSEYILSFEWTVALVILFQVLFFRLFRTYAGVIRLSGYIDAAKLLLAISSNAGVLFVFNLLVFIFQGNYLFSNIRLFVYAVVTFMLLFSVRLIIKISYDFFMRSSGTSIPVMIYGTKHMAVGIAQMLRTDPNGKYKLVGFIDNEKNHTQWSIMGIKVYFLNEENVKNIIAKKAKAVIVSPLKMEEINPRKDLDLFVKNGITIMLPPPIDTWKDGKPISSKQLKPIRIEDLLERPQIQISTENIGKQLNSKVVLITGAAGSIGSEIVRQVSKHNPSLIVLLDQAESPMHDLKLELEKKYPDLRFILFLGDVRNQLRMEYMMNLYKPDFIYHAAAYKHVPLMEDNPVESILTNVQGTKTMADLAVKHKVQDFVMVSTDKAVNPTNVMGASKRIAEVYVQSLARKITADKNGVQTKFITTRFGNVLGSNGSVIPHFKKQIENGGPITVTHPEIIRYFMTIPEACMLVLEAGAMGEGGEIFIFDMGDPVKIVDLARKMIHLAGFKPDEEIKIAFTGLRPGEKLYEELLNHKETTATTHHPKIMVAKVQEYNYNEISTMIDELIYYGSQCKDFLVVSQMKKIIPEFLSNNSPYEILDIEKE